MWRLAQHMLASLLLLLLIGAGVGLAVFQKQQGKILSVQSGSMEPGISKGDLVVVKRIPAHALKRGDVITFINPLDGRQTITHRIMQSTPGPADMRYFVTKGDANAAEDAAIPSIAVIGKVVQVVPYVGHALDLMRKPLGLALLVYVPALVVVFGELRRLSAYYRSQQPYIVPELAQRRRSDRSPQAAAMLVLGVLAVSFFASPARAALQSQTTLTSNTISVGTPPVQAAGITLRRAFVTCSTDDPAVAAKVRITLYNASKVPVSADSWQVRSGADPILTVPAPTSVAARSTLDLDSPTLMGVSYNHGSLTLYDASGQPLGHLVWQNAEFDRACRTVE